MKLAEIYELMNEPKKALELVYEGSYTNCPSNHHFLIRTLVIDSRKRRLKEVSASQPTESTAASTSLFEEKAAKVKGAKAPSRLTHAQLRELEAEKEKEVLRGYRIVKEQWAGMLAGDEEAVKLWLTEAEKLVETFRETRNLFLTSRVRLLFFCLAKCFGCALTGVLLD